MRVQQLLLFPGWLVWHWAGDAAGALPEPPTSKVVLVNDDRLMQCRQWSCRAALSKQIQAKSDPALAGAPHLSWFRIQRQSRVLAVHCQVLWAYTQLTAACMHQSGLHEVASYLLLTLNVSIH